MARLIDIDLEREKQQKYFPAGATEQEYSIGMTGHTVPNVAVSFSEQYRQLTLAQTQNIMNSISKHFEFGALQQFAIDLRQDQYIMFVVGGSETSDLFENLEFDPRHFSEGFQTMLASEMSLAKVWDTPEEDEAWKDL